MTWVVKICVHPYDAGSVGEVYRRAAIGPIPPFVVLGVVFGLYLWLLYLALSPHGRRAGADEIRGIEQELTRWKM